MRHSSGSNYSSGSASLIPLAQRSEWQNALDSVSAYDVYHTPEFQQTEETESNRIVLFHFCDTEGSAVIPLTLRSINTLDWYHGEWLDASSVYGYPGPLSSQSQPSQAFCEAFDAALVRTLAENDVVSAFVRRNPMLGSALLLGSYATESGTTVYLDLQQDLETQLAQARKKHRYEARKTLQLGVTVTEDASFAHIDEFRSIYDAHMHALDASDSYFFGEDYYRALTALPNNGCLLFHAWLDGEIAASALFLQSLDGLQYHLSATKSGFEKLSPTRAIVEHVRQWGTERKKHWLHLGGGVGGQEDSLFRFKAGFSKHRAVFSTARIIVSDKRYQTLCDRRVDSKKEMAINTDFFPAYRS